MEFNKRPRHQFRAQGREGRRSSNAGVAVAADVVTSSRPIISSVLSRIASSSIGSLSSPSSTFSSPSSFEETKTADALSSALIIPIDTEVASSVVSSARPGARAVGELLDFLSKTAAVSEKVLLTGVVDPGFEKKKRLPSAKSSRGIPSNSNFNVDPDAVRRLNELLDKSRSLTFDEASAGSVSHSVADMAGDSNAPAPSGMLKDLNDWLSGSHAHADDLETLRVTSTETAKTTEAEFISGAPLVSFARPFTTEPLNTSVASFSIDKVYSARIGLNAASRPAFGNEVRVDSGAASLFMRPLFRQRAKKAFATRTLNNGRRFESYDTGAVLEKDEFGRVTQIRSVSGASISVYYDRDGNPEGFVRVDEKGRTHSIAECDKQGVVVRDETGRPRAQGDSLSIDPRGCLSICRSDGQFWSVDLVYGRHIERRRLCDEAGVWHVLTGIFAADGFRMMTLFQSVIESPQQVRIRGTEAANRWWSNAPLANGSFRFYGRDGSVIEFASEHSLTDLQPAHVWSPGTRSIEPVWKGRHQAGTAWDSVQEYVSSYLSR